MTRRLWTLLAVLALCAGAVHAIYEDQAGEFDWSVENLGRASAVAFGGAVTRGQATATRGTTRALYVASDSRSRALARLDAKTGAVKWRHVFHAGDAIDAVELTNYGLLSVSGSGKTLRLWDAADGGLLWDSIAYNGASASAFGGLFVVGDDRVAVVSSSGAALVSVKDGRVLWKAALPSGFHEQDSSLSAQLTSDGSSLAVLSGTQVVKISLAAGSVSPGAAVAVGASLHKNSHDGAVFAASVAERSLSLASVESDGVASTVDIASLSVDDGETFTSIDASIKSALVVNLSSGKRVVIKVSQSLSGQAVHVVPNGGALVESVTDDVTLFHAAAIAGANQVQVTSFPLADGQHDQFSWDAELSVPIHGGDVATGFIGCPMRKKDTAAAPRCRAVLVMKDDALVMTTNEESDASDASLVARNVLWVREEALANIKQVRWVTPAETDIEKQAIKGIPSFVEEVQLEFARLESLASNVMALFEENSKSTEGRARKEPRNSHLFGFSKYIIALTESGKLYAIRAEASTVAWSVFVGAQYRLFVTRDQPALGAGSELLLVSNTSELVWFDGDNGHLVESIQAGSGDEDDQSWVILLPKRKHLIDEEPSSRRAVAVVSAKSLDVALYPAETAGFAHPELTNFYFYRYDKTSNSLHGYMISDVDDGKAAYRARQVWSIVLPKDQSVVASSQYKEYTVSDSSVTITGDDSLLLKYLNPNLFGIATLSTDPAEGVLTVSLFDSVSGRTIHRARHEHASGPVHMVQSENWVVYSYWNTKEKRTELVSLVLFDGAVGSHSLNLWKRPIWAESRSAFDSKAPFLLQKSFIYPTKIQSLGVTVTSHGITPQFVLVGMENGQIFKLGRNFIDPRQPEKPLTPEEQAEGLMVYTPLVPVYNRPQAMATNNKTVANLKEIVSAPAELESTTLVFAHGLDLFYVRMAPAKAFDLLPSDFQYEMLVLLCLGFLVATFVTKRLAQRKALREAWK